MNRSRSTTPPETGLACASPETMPSIPDHELLRCIGGGSYGEVWLARNALGAYRAVKIVRRTNFDHERPFEREFAGIQKFEPISRQHEGLVDLLQVGRNDAEGYFYYVMELADPSESVISDQYSVSSRPASTSGETSSRSPQKTDSLNTDLLITEYSPKTLRSEIQRRSRVPLDECLTVALALTRALGYLHGQGLVHRDIKPSNIIFVGGLPKLADVGLVASVDEARSYVGTEGFIPPEGPGSPQADLYGLGIVLYVMSTGQRHEDFPAPLPDLSAQPDHARWLEFNAVVHRACAADARARYRSAEEMAADLERLARGVSIRCVRRMERVWRGFRRGAKWAAVAAIVLSASVFVIRTGRQPVHRAVERRSTNEVANRYFDLGLHAFERLAFADIPLAVTNFQKAIEADPRFARAHSELALIYSRPQGGKGNRESYTAAKTEAELALKLDPALPLAHVVIGWSKVFHGFRWREAEKDFLRALELDPHWDRSHHGYAEFLKASGRPDHAVAEMREALRCNPQSVRVRQRLPWVLVAARRFEEAIKEAEVGIAMEPNSVGNAHHALIDAWCALGNFPKAIEAQQRLLLAKRTSSEEITLRIGNLRKAFEMDGVKGYWRVQLKDTQQIDDSPYWLARIHAQLGERKQALDCLTACSRDVAFDLIWSVKVDWQLDPLRSEPAFQDILKALNLE